MMASCYITKDKTAIIKGFAILFMIAHHCLIKEFYINAPDILTSIPTVHLQIGMKMCVGLFTFIVGYGFFYASKPGLNYGISHIVRLLKKYVPVLLLSIAIVALG